MTTSRKKTSRSNKRMGTAMRGDLNEAYDVRGNAKAHLYTAFSLKANKDVVLTRDLRLCHFFLRESEPDVVAIAYQPEAMSEQHGKLCSVEFISRDHTLYVESVIDSRGLHKARIEAINAELTKHYPSKGKHRLGDYQRVITRVVTEQDVIPGNETRLRNWNRLLQRYASTRYLSLAHAEQLFFARLEGAGPCDIKTLVQMQSQHACTAQLLSAAIKATATGECCGDLHLKQFSMNSRFWIRGRR